jgi:thiosulfate reductase/polysulfide reductase chain A
VTQNTVGFDELKKEVSKYTPDWAAPLTGIPAETIMRIAHEFAAAAPHALAHNGWRTSNFINSFHTQRAIGILNALVGNWDVTLSAGAGEESGTLGAPTQPPFPRISALRLDGVPWKYPVVPLKIGVFQELRDNIVKADPYQAHGWFISRQNPILSIPDRGKTLEAFGKMDFIVTMDIILNDTAWFSDVILPEASYLERYDPLVPIGNKIFLRQPVIETQGEAKSAMWVYKQLGERLGLGDFFQYKDEEDYIRQQLAPLGVSLEDVKTKGYAQVPETPHLNEGKEPSWNTPSKKIELYSDTLAKVGFPGIPIWVEPPQPAADQFYLLTGKVAQSTQTATQNNQLLHKYSDEPRLWMNVKTAAKLGLATDDWVEVKSEVGKIHIRLLATEAIRPDCVYMTPGFGHLSKGLKTAFGIGASDSAVHVTYTDPISGGQALSQTFVTVTKA